MPYNIIYRELPIIKWSIALIIFRLRNTRGAADSARRDYRVYLSCSEKCRLCRDKECSVVEWKTLLLFWTPLSPSPRPPLTHGFEFRLIFNIVFVFGGRGEIIINKRLNISSSYFRNFTRGSKKLKFVVPNGLKKLHFYIIRFRNKRFQTIWKHKHIV